MNIAIRYAAAALLAVGASASAHATSSSSTAALDTGAPAGNGFPLVLDGTDYYAAEFSLGASQSVITTIQAYLTGGNVGDTFTVSLYSAANGLPGNYSLWSGQATFQGNGWNGLSGLNLHGLSAGNYWAAFEVGSLDSATGLLLPIGASGGTAPARAYAFNDGAGYQALSGYSFAAQVVAVPEPGAVLLLPLGVVALLLARRRLGGMPRLA